MTRIVIVGEAFYGDLRPDQGLPGVPPGYWGGVAPPYPDQGLPGRPPRPTHPIAPGGGRPPGYWGGEAPPYPDQGLPGGQGGTPSQPIYHPGHPDHGLPAYPDQGLPGLPPGVPTQPWVPPSGETLPPPPEDIVNEYVVAVWNPTKQEWTVQVATGATPK